MNMQESYSDAMEWLSKHSQNRIIIKVKTDKELKAYQKYFRVQIDSDLFTPNELYNVIEWKIDPTIEK